MGISVVINATFVSEVDGSRRIVVMVDLGVIVLTDFSSTCTCVLLVDILTGMASSACGSLCVLYTRCYLFNSCLLITHEVGVLKL